MTRTQQKISKNPEKLGSRKMLVVIACVAALFLAGPAASQGSTVKVGFYGEALCPDCIHFINGPLTHAFKEVPDIFTLHYAPLGNAKMVDGKLECQHGPMECTMNTVEACALYYYPNMTQYFPFLACLAKVGPMMDPETGEKCAEKNDMTWDKINTCYQGDQGHSLELGYYNETRSLEAAQHYTPWITIDGEHDTSAEGDGLVKEICKAYKGTNRPKACML